MNTHIRAALQLIGIGPFRFRVTREDYHDDRAPDWLVVPEGTPYRTTREAIYSRAVAVYKDEDAALLCALDLSCNDEKGNAAIMLRDAAREGR